ncbi:MAG: hypothetical protein K2X27_21420 [Candidatus Obscuribacterales bacterium]|nr:hypothetical protein [Candidatus Obscuribacterales bacterium]
MEALIILLSAIALLAVFWLLLRALRNLYSPARKRGSIPFKPDLLPEKLDWQDASHDTDSFLPVSEWSPDSKSQSEEPDDLHDPANSWKYAGNEQPVVETNVFLGQTHCYSDGTFVVYDRSGKLKFYVVEGLDLDDPRSQRFLRESFNFD